MFDKIVYFIRHGESQNNEHDQHGGHSDVHLSEKGRRQALEIGTVLKDIPFDTLICSDLRRARETAAIALPQYTPLEYRAELREINVGILMNKERSWCRKTYGEKYADCRARNDYTGFNGESNDDLYARAAKFMKEMETRDLGHRVAVVCHGGFIVEAANFVLGGKVPHEAMELDNCSVSMLQYKKGGWHFLKWNQCAEFFNETPMEP